MRLKDSRESVVAMHARDLSRPVANSSELFAEKPIKQLDCAAVKPLRLRESRGKTSERRFNIRALSASDHDLGFLAIAAGPSPARRSPSSSAT